MKRLNLFAVAFLMGMNLLAQIRLPEVFTDNMVLQREKTVNIWGTAEPDTKVTVVFNGQKQTAKTDMQGEFFLKLAPMEANAVPQTLTVSTKKSKKTLKNILVGEVWLAGGQSNMEFNMGPVWRGGSMNKVDEPKKGKNLQKEALDLGDDPMMRLLLVEKELKCDTLPSHGWKEMNRATMEPMSAVAYFYAKNLIDSLQVPVGIIESCWGGTIIQDWMTGDSGYRYKRMIKPVVPFTIRGFIWYQGCSNLDRGETEAYYEMQKSLVGGWRLAWNDTSLPFYFVELAPMTYADRRNYLYPCDFTSLPKFRAVQHRLAEDVPYTAVVSTLDLCDNVKDIHPTYKWEVGRRLADVALNRIFGRDDIQTEGPKMVSVTKKEKKQFVVEFDQPLTTNDGKKPVGFVMINSSGSVIKSEAQVDGNKVIITLTQNKEVNFVAYCWDEKFVSNLCGLNGLPARQFPPTHI